MPSKYTVASLDLIFEKLIMVSNQVHCWILHPVISVKYPELANHNSYQKNFSRQFNPHWPTIDLWPWRLKMTRVRNRVTQSQSVIILGLRLYLESKFVAINEIIITKILSIKINRRCIDVTAYNWAEVEIGFISKLWWHKNN